jgi:hypothetical protein
VWATSVPQFHRLEAVVERVVEVHTGVAGERFIVTHRDAGPPQPLDQLGQPGDDQRWVRPARRTEVGVDAEVRVQLVPLDPAPTAPAEVSRLVDMGDAPGSPVSTATAASSPPAGIASCR